MKVDIWIHVIENIDDTKYAVYLEEMNKDFSEKVYQYKFYKDRIKRVSGRLMLEKAIEYSDRKIDLSKELIKNAFNKPFINNWYNFNFSYSEKMVVLAFSESVYLGIDIEYLRVFDYHSMRTQLHQNEIDYMKKHNNSLKSFYDIWVKKESLVKAEGTGIRDDLNQMDCSGNSNQYFNRIWYFKNIEVLDGYVCNLCTNFTPVNVHVSYLSVNQLKH